MSIDSSKHTGFQKVLLDVFVGLIALFGSQIIAGLIMSFYPLIRHWSASQGNNWLNNSTAAQFIYVVLAETMAVYLVYWFLKKYHHVSLKTIGLRKPKLSDPVIGLIGMPAYLVIYLVLVKVVTIFAPQLNVSEKQQLGFNGVNGPANIVMAFLALVVLPPIAEEIIFRGLIYTSLRQRLSLWVSAIITSLLFAAGHLLEGGSAGPLYIAGIDTFSLSLVLVYIREKTGGLYAGMTLHALKNLIAFIALLASKQL